MIRILFWTALGFVIYTYFIYPFIIFILGCLFHRHYLSDESYLPSVTLVISAYNEELLIGQRIGNALKLDYPSEQLNILVISDGSDDETDRIVEGFEGVDLFRTNARVGKSEGINMAFREGKVESEIVVFSDANSVYGENAIRELVKHFADERIGLVSGEFRYKHPSSDIGRGENLYWKYETFLRKQEAKLGKLLSPNGSIYAIRRKCFVPVRKKAASDFQMGEDIAIQGYDLIYEQKAVVREDTCIPIKEEFDRKARIIAGCMEAAARQIWFMKPYRLFQMISHKVLRWLVPLFLILVFILNAFLLDSVFYGITFVLQIVFYLSALMGWFLYETRIGIFMVPLYFVTVNAASLKGMFRFATRTHRATWEIPFSTRR